MSKIHYWELSNYVGGKLIGQWFELDNISHDEHIAEITEWLEELTNETGELCEEWIVGDVEDVPSHYVGEYSIDEAFFELAELAENSHLDREVFEAAADYGIPLDKVEDAYYGCFESDQALAEDYVDQTALLAEVPENLQSYFDFAAFGRDLAMDFCESNGHYFYSNY